MADSVTAALDRLKSTFDGQIFFDQVTRSIYSTDASVYQETPAAVVFPKTDSDIKSLILLAIETGIGLIPRTAGTSLAGQVVGSGVVLDVSRYFTNIIEVNDDEKWVRVQPGVIRDELNLALKPHGLMFGPETSTANRAMIGGMLGNNSAGSNSIIYGTTRDQTLEVSGFLSDGSRVHFGPLVGTEFQAKINGEDGSLETSIYRGINTILSDPENRAEIAREFPKPSIHRRNTGYAIDRLMDCQVFGESTKPFNMCQLIAGSEGTIFFATEIKLRICQLPPPVDGLLCAHFETVDQALRATQLAMGFNPYACELIDHLILEGAARNAQQIQNSQFVEGTPGAILVVEIRGSDRREVTTITDQIQTELRSAGLGYAFPVVFGEQTRQVWDLRKAGLGVANNIPGDAKPVAVIEDAAVDVDDLPDYVREVDQLLESKYGVRCVHYAHAGAGEIHLRPVLNLKSKDGIELFRAIASDVASLVKTYRGSLSGEHGDGRIRAGFLEQMIGSHNFQLIREIKRLWDPHGILNPGKIVDPPAMNSALRYQAGQKTPEIETVFDFGETHGMLRAAEMCNGSGDCRKTHLSGGTMCPSYMATRNEADTTRARANLLRRAMTDTDPFNRDISDEDVFQILDLCLSCKGCKRECPSNVDMAKLKAEFLQRYYDTHGIPRRTRLIADFNRIVTMASKVPWLFNWLTTNALTGDLIKRWSGFSRKRSLPRLAPQTLRNWFKRHTSHPAAGARGEVNLFCDEFTNFNDVQVGIATIELLERLGWKVDIPEHIESGRAAISKGLLRRARDIAKSNVTSLAGVVTASKPLIGIEPSAILTFRDEYPDLLRGGLQSQSKQLARDCLMIDEFLDRAELDSGLFCDDQQLIRLHGHCHQTAVGLLAATVRMLQLPKNYRVRLIPSGCCGMAGSFGYEREHYEISMQIGELVLFPAVRNEPADSLIAAAGTSCRHQIYDGTGKRALHPIEILRDALV